MYICIYVSMYLFFAIGSCAFFLSNNSGRNLSACVVAWDARCMAGWVGHTWHYKSPLTQSPV